MAGYVEVFGVAVLPQDYQAMVEECKALWSEMDEPYEDYDSYEEFEDLHMHAMLYSEE